MATTLTTSSSTEELLQIVSRFFPVEQRARGFILPNLLQAALETILELVPILYPHLRKIFKSYSIMTFEFPSHFIELGFSALPQQLLFLVLTGSDIREALWRVLGKNYEGETQLIILIFSEPEHSIVRLANDYSAQVTKQFKLSENLDLVRNVTKLLPPYSISLIRRLGENTYRYGIPHLADVLLKITNI